MKSRKMLIAIFVVLFIAVLIAAAVFFREKKREEEFWANDDLSGYGLPQDPPEMFLFDGANMTITPHPVSEG